MILSQLVDVPSSIKINGQSCLVIERMQNFHYRALVLPPLDRPRWLSNDEVAQYTGVLDATKNPPEVL